MRVTVYTRQKNELGQWRYLRTGGRGRRTAAEGSGPFYMRHAGITGRQVWTPAKADNLEDAKAEAEKLSRALAAESSGLVVHGIEKMTNANRVTLADAIRDFLALKASKSPRTVKAYALNLREFQEAVGKRVHYLDDVEASTLRKFKEFMQQKGHAGKTQHTRLLTVIFMLKKNGIKNPLPWDEMPAVEVDPAIPFEPGELKKLFAAMTPHEALRYKFFLGSGAREQEVSFASWKDVDLQKNTFTIRQKPDVGFTPKSHETRTVPLPMSLVQLLKAEKLEKSKRGPAIFGWPGLFALPSMFPRASCVCHSTEDLTYSFRWRLRNDPHANACCPCTAHRLRTWKNCFTFFVQP